MMRLVMAMLIAALAGCGGGDNTPPTQAVLSTTIATAEYFETMATPTHDSYEQDQTALRTILENDNAENSAYAQQMHFELIVTDSKVLPVLVLEYVQEMDGKISRLQLVEVFEKVRITETEHYAGKLQELYDLWNIPLPAETVQALQDAITDNYHDVEKEL